MLVMRSQPLHVRKRFGPWLVQNLEKNKGRIVEIIRALYGLATASRSFHEFLGDTLRRMGSNPLRADQDLWWRKYDNYEGYDYVATHVDDIIIVSKNPSQYMIKLEQEFNVRNIEDSPSYYLGNNIKKILGKYFHSSPAQYVQEALRNMNKNMGRSRNIFHQWDQFTRRKTSLHF